MKKFIFQFLQFVCGFLILWLLLSQINFVKHFKIEELNQKSEDKIGKTMVDFILKANDSIRNDSVSNTIRGFKDLLCKHNGIDSSKIRIYIVNSSEINAFALPGNNMVIFTGIIEFCKTPEELTSVMAHEMAHIEGLHVSKKMTKEIGLSILTTIASGDAGSTILRDVIKTLSSTAFDREMERNADSVAVRYLTKANIDPEHFANMLYRLSKKTDIPEALEWISTHPDTKERTAEILKLRKKYKFQSKPLLSDEVWKGIQQKIKKEDQE